MPFRTYTWIAQLIWLNCPPLKLKEPMSWFNRTDKGILTPTESKREVPDGLWFKSPGGKIVHTRELKNNSYVVPEEDFHVRVGSKEYFEILFDNNEFTELDA